MEQGLFHSTIDPIVLQFQKYLHLYESGQLPKDAFQMFEADVVETLISPGGNEWWEVSKAKFPVVSDYLDQRILELKDSVVPTHLDFEGWLNRTKHPDWPLLAVSGVKTKQI